MADTTRPTLGLKRLRVSPTLGDDVDLFEHTPVRSTHVPVGLKRPRFACTENVDDTIHPVVKRRRLDIRGKTERTRVGVACSACKFRNGRYRDGAGGYHCLTCYNKNLPGTCSTPGCERSFSNGRYRDGTGGYRCKTCYRKNGHVTH